MAAEDEADALPGCSAPQGSTVETFDERLTTVSAERSLADAGRHGPGTADAVVDQAAAAVLLQAWLDARRAAVTMPDASAGP